MGGFPLRNTSPSSKKGAKRLQERVLRDSRLKRRLEAIVTRGHLEDVSEETLRKEMISLELDPDRLLDKKGRLTFKDEDIPEVLQFLNEDLFYGALTNEGFRADKKASQVAAVGHLKILHLDRSASGLDRRAGDRAPAL